MASSCTIRILLLLLLFVSIATTLSLDHDKEPEPEPVPKAWPDQFHATVVTNLSGELQLINLWYDWTNRRNLNVIQYQLGNLVYDVQWNNGTSFFYTLDSDLQFCSSLQVEVGILRRNWMEGATYLGQRYADGGFLCNVWEKADYFITYYEDVVTRLPVTWTLFTGKVSHFITFEEGAALEDAKWQAPSYCFDQKSNQNGVVGDVDDKTKSDAYHSDNLLQRFIRKDEANAIGTGLW